MRQFALPQVRQRHISGHPV